MKKTVFSLTSFLLLTTLTLFSSPVAPSCTQPTTAYCCGFGILNVTFNTINNTTANGSDGYKDYSSTINTNVLAGQTYTISINVSGAGAGKHNVRVWIDYNNDGTLDSLAELVFTAIGVQTTSGAINIPGSAVRNTQLRMRVSADYELAATFGPCRPLQNGQAEDYAVTILNNTNPPDVAFTANKTTTCDGAVTFTDKSLNLPTSWLWYFGDGTTSNQQNPVHTYTANGTYTVKLRATNTNGNDIDSIVNYIQVALGSAPIAASCTPNTLAYCCQYGITSVSFGSINKTSADASEGYKDFSCTNQAVFYSGTHPISIITGSLNPHDLKVWIDFNNDGVFNTTNEQVYTSTNQKTHTGNITIPASTPVFTPLRMRITADYVGNTISPCGSPSFGQTEDYTVISQGTIGIAEEVEKIKLKVYPNPTNGLVTIEYSFGNNENLTIFISDMLGREIQKIVSNGENKQVINLSALPKGIYFIEASSGEKRLTKKLILQ